MANPTERAWEQGYKTGLNGKPESLCPYAKGPSHLAWTQGWQQGVKARSEKQG